MSRHANRPARPGLGRGFSGSQLGICQRAEGPQGLPAGVRALWSALHTLSLKVTLLARPLSACGEFARSLPRRPVMAWLLPLSRRAEVYFARPSESRNE